MEEEGRREGQREERNKVRGIKSEGKGEKRRHRGDNRVGESMGVWERKEKGEREEGRGF